MVVGIIKLWDVPEEYHLVSFYRLAGSRGGSLGRERVCVGREFA
jgi:hypothetical protein